ncbi:MAG: N-acetyltransferase [Candidatus Eremiobacter antarcticus]|nr:N-acetyltransferase [Candidatus Eremiobacteraeota bacterium]MBC5808990.1 N-acetyltransferase [Candidatus Eremiobacteraeota bacterium]PZR60528.1 MAG: N-acetyltransferase [Candidatus Eremiobacter sp. RRmetagenome_bin22]
MPAPRRVPTSVEPPAPRIHPTAIIEQDVHLGAGCAIWDNVHVRRGTTLGAECIVGEKTHISYDVRIGNRVKINAFVYICTGVTIEDGVMVCAGCVFTNDRTPRATSSDLSHLRTSEPDEHTTLTTVREGATLGARSVIGSDLTIGRFAMIGMGSVVTKSVPDFHLALGNPARIAGCVCRCGKILFRLGHERSIGPSVQRCTACGLQYRMARGVLSEMPQHGEDADDGVGSPSGHAAK